MNIKAYIRSIRASLPMVTRPIPKTIEDYLGLQAIQDGLLILRGGTVLILEFHAENFMLKSSDEQAAILQTYRERFLALKTPYQICITAKPADMSAHTEVMRRHMKSQPGHLQAHIEDYIEFTRSVTSRTAVSRRFFVALRYAGPPTDDWTAIRGWLHEKQSILTQTMRKCGNDPVEHQDRDRFVAEVLYSMLCPRTSVVLPLPSTLGRPLTIEDIPTPSRASRGGDTT